MRNLKQTEIQRLTNRGENAEDKKQKDRSRKRTKKLQKQNKRLTEKEAHEKQRLRT